MHKKPWADNLISPLKWESESTNLIKWGQRTTEMTEEPLTAALCPAVPQGHASSFDAINWLSGLIISPLDVNGILSFWKGRYCSKKVNCRKSLFCLTPANHKSTKLFAWSGCWCTPFRDASNKSPVCLTVTCGSSSFLSGYFWEIIPTFTIPLSLNVLWKS